MGKQITFHLSDVETKYLFDQSERECRRLNDQAKYLILKSLGLVIDNEVKPKMNNRRYCMAQDDSGHWYVIPHDETTAFDEWVNAMSKDDVSYEGAGYDHCRINGSPSRVVFPSYEVL